MSHTIPQVDNARLRQARVITLASLGMAVVSSVTLPGIALLLETRPLWIALGGLGLLLFCAAQAGRCTRR